METLYKGNSFKVREANSNEQKEQKKVNYMISSQV